MEARLFLNTIFNIATIRNNPTPIPTVKINTVLLITSATCEANTVKSGSATVISTPITKQTDSRSRRFFDFVNPEPTCSPIGVIEISAPKLNKPIPKIRNREETKNIINSRIVKFNNGVKFNNRTISETGKTDTRAYFNFSNSAFFKRTLLSVFL